MDLDFFRDCFPLVFVLAAFVVVFEVMLGCPFLDSRAAGRGRGVVRWEIVRIFVRRPSLGKGRQPTFVQSPISNLLIELLAYDAN
jgi:hypothetical protein